MRTLSLAAREALFREQSGDVPVFLVTIVHDDLDGPRRLSTDPTNRVSTDPLQYATISRGQTYSYLPMSVALPEEAEETPPSLRLVLDNVMRDLVPLLRSTSIPALVTVEFVLASDPDTVEIEWGEFELTLGNYNSTNVTIDLTIDSLTHEPYPSGRFNPGAFGGLF